MNVRAFLIGVVLVSVGGIAPAPAEAQRSRHADVWNFGTRARIAFDATATTITRTVDPVIVTGEGCASFSDPETGVLKIYSDGINVWNGAGTPVGTGLGGSPSSMHSGVIVPVPGTPNHVYVFGHPSQSSTFIRYQEYDLTLAAAAVGTVQQVNFPRQKSEGMLLIQHDNGNDYWLVVSGRTDIWVLPITSAGVGAPVATPTGASLLWRFGWHLFAASHQGDRIVYGVNREGASGSTSGSPLGEIVTWSFDNATGALSARRQLTTGYRRQYYGGEFSPDGTKIYFATLDESSTGSGGGSGHYQYDLTTGAFTRLHYSAARYTHAALKLGPDGLIYAAQNNASLGRISNPDGAGAASGYTYAAVALAAGSSARLGLPQTPSPEAEVTLDYEIAITGPTGTVAGSSVTPAGTSNTAPGSTVTVTVTAPGYMGSCMATVAADGSWSCPADAISGLPPGETITMEAEVVDAVTMETAMDEETFMTTTCFDAGAGTDPGCSAAAPFCDASGTPRCVECLAASDCDDENECTFDTCGGGTCFQTIAPAGSACTGGVCDGLPIPMCVTCLDTGGPAMIDAGCVSASPICDVAASMCLPCVNDMAGAATDSGCIAASPLCVGSGASSSCVPCEDSGAGTDTGCTATAPVCDEGGAVPICRPCLDDMPGALTDTGCGMAAPLCDSDRGVCVTCDDDAMGAVDTGCGGMTPVCDARGSVPVCVSCEDTASGAAPDYGCDGDRPFCAASPAGGFLCVECDGAASCDDMDPCTADTCDAAGACTNTTLPTGSACGGGDVCDGSGDCVDCINDIARGRDSGCFSSAPVCDTSGSTPSCVSCQDDTMGRLDDGCGLAAPVCEGSGADVACTLCEDSAPAGSTDNGCGALEPVCATDGSGETCVECLVDADCPGGACVTATNTCVTCADDMPGAATDTGCTDAAPICLSGMTGPPRCVPCENTAVTGLDSGCTTETPVCDESGAVPTCVVCDDTGDATDDGCTAGSPICDEGGESAVCIACVTSADCEDPTPVCNPANECVPGCVSDANCAATPDTPVCDTASMSCVECLDDAACDGTTPVCDVPVTSCVGCLDDDDCPSGRCDTATDMCVGCLSDADCPGAVCDPASDTCLECLIDSDCPPGSTCGEDNTCGPQCRSDLDCLGAVPELPVCDVGECVECVDREDCGEGEVCTDTRTCAPECTEDADCAGALPVCLEEGGYCVECDAEAGCAESEVCDLDTNTCSSGCEDDSECIAPPDRVCDEPVMVCVECTNDDECFALCDEDTNTCVDCVVDADCGDGTCTAGACVGSCTMDSECTDPTRPICGDGACVECGADIDCADGEICDDAVCAPGCSSDIECPDGVCDPASSRCVGCLDDTHCAEGEVCDTMTNLCAAQCASDDDCAAPTPICADEGICVGCASDDDCATDAAPFCGTDRTCVGCRDDADCPDGACDLESALCVDDGGCSDDSDCPETTPICREDGMCVACTDEDPGICADDELGSACVMDTDVPRCGCVDDEDCPDGFVCGADGTCARPSMPMTGGGISGGALCATPLGTKSGSGFAGFALMMLALVFARRRR